MEVTTSSSDDERGEGGKQTSSYRCGRRSSTKMILMQAFVVLVSATLVKATALLILYQESLPGTRASSWMPQIRAILPYLSYVAYPLTGSLLTGALKRHDLVRHSLGATWGATVGTSALLVLRKAGYMTSTTPALSLGVFIVAYLILTFALAVYHSNALPLALEQLESAANGEVVFFVRLYFGLEFLAYGVAAFYLPASLCSDCAVDTNSVALYVSFASAAAMTVVMVLSLLCRDHVVLEEPNASNPLALVLKVCLYSRKVHSSLYTVGNNNVSGVPFTKKEVEDVRSLYHFLPLFLPLGFVMATYVVTGTTAPYLFRSPYVSFNATTTTWVEASSSTVPYVAVPISMLAYHFCSLLCSQHFKIIHRVVLGTLIMAACVAVDLVLAGLVWSKGEDNLHQPLTYFTLEVITSAVSGASVFLTASAVIEFVCAQSSFPVKALLINLKYMTEGLGVLIGIMLVLIFSELLVKFWFVLASILPIALAVVSSLYNARGYRMRRRDDKRYEDLSAERVSIFSSYTPSSTTKDEPSSVV